MGNEYLCHLIFTFFKFILKNFIFLKIVYGTMMSPNIFLLVNKNLFQFLTDTLFFYKSEVFSNLFDDA